MSIKSRNLVLEYRSWQMMKNRCGNPRAHNFAYYGGNGIVVCSRWLGSFEAFLSDMGPRPSPSHSLDRIDGRGNYEPSNCRWSTKSEQAFNRSSKGGPRGEAHGMSKLTEFAVRVIRRCTAFGMSGPQVGAVFSVDGGTIGRISRREKWKCVP